MNTVKSLVYGQKVVYIDRSKMPYGALYGLVKARPYETDGIAKVEWISPMGSAIGKVTMCKIGFDNEYELAVYAELYPSHMGWNTAPSALENKTEEKQKNVEELRKEMFSPSQKINQDGNSTRDNNTDYTTSNICTETGSEQRSKTSAGSPIKSRRSKPSIEHRHFSYQKEVDFFENKGR